MRFPQFVTEIDGQRIHFYHVRSPEPDANRDHHARLAGLGRGVSRRTWAAQQSARLWRRSQGRVSRRSAFSSGLRIFRTPTRTGLARQACYGSVRYSDASAGYKRYFAQGGDKGSLITILLGALYADRVPAIHLTILSAPPLDSANPKAGLDAEEAAYLDSNARFVAEGSAYQQVHRTRPQTLAVALMDSPAGMAAWIVDKFQAWADCDGVIENVIPRDHLLDNISLYWLTGTIGSSMRFYFEDNGPGRTEPLPTVRVPTGLALFPGEILKTPRSWAEQRFNITRWTKMPRGGHFAAMEQPDLFVDEVRAFFRETPLSERLRLIDREYAARNGSRGIRSEKQHKPIKIALLHHAAAREGLHQFQTRIAGEPVFVEFGSDPPWANRVDGHAVTRPFAC